MNQCKAARQYIDITSEPFKKNTRLGAPPYAFFLFFFYKTDAVSIHKHYLVSSSSLCPASPAPVLEASPSRHSPFSYSSIGCHFVLGKSKSKKHAKTHLVLSGSDVQPSNLLSPGRQTYERPPQAHRTFKQSVTQGFTPTLTHFQVCQHYQAHFMYVQKQFYRHSVVKTNSIQSIRNFF